MYYCRYFKTFENIKVKQISPLNLLQIETLYKIAGFINGISIWVATESGARGRDLGVAGVIPFFSNPLSASTREPEHAQKIKYARP